MSSSGPGYMQTIIITPYVHSMIYPFTTTYGLNSFSYSSVKYWNSLPDHFRKTVDYSEFKRKLLVHGFS